MGPLNITLSTIKSTTTSPAYFSFSSSSSFFWLTKLLHILPSTLFFQPFWFYYLIHIMEQTLGLLGGGGGGSSGGPGGSSGGSGGGGLSNETASSAVSKVEKDYMGLSSEGSSYENEAEIELGLGLSLSSGGGTGGVGRNKGTLWGDYGRILTAKDLPNGFSGRAAGVSGTKRAADCVSAAENAPPSTGVSSQVVGWPPIRAYRMNSLVNQSKTPNVDEDKGVGGNEKKENSKKKTNYGNHKADDAAKEKGHLGYIKVNMDGVPIGRKVDLNAHNCYESLAEALEDMFFNTIAISGEKEPSRQPPKLLDESSEFVLTYEDKEGDWMLVGDVPWGMFLCTVKRLRIMRNSEANGIAPTIQERHERQKGKPI